MGEPKITEVQRRVMCRLALEGPLTHPRGTLERLAKKGLVEGGRAEGWSLTSEGKRIVASFKPTGKLDRKYEIW